MILDLKSVFIEDGSSLNKEYSFSMSDIEISGEKPFISPISVNITAINRAGLVKLFLATDFNYQRPCDRCGTVVTKNMQLKFEHCLVTSLSGDQNDDYIETPNHTIDIDELLRADILLEIPSKHLCSDDCKGLCPVCGVNLNEKSCNCTTKEIDPRLEVLKNFMN